LLVPSVSLAWGCRRRGRRCRTCGCQTCGCQPCGTKITPFLTTTPCQYACPFQYYGRVNGVYYYCCYCCTSTGVNGYVNASSSSQLSYPQYCSNTTNCINTGSSGTFEPVPYRAVRRLGYLNFLPSNDHFSGKDHVAYIKPTAGFEPNNDP